MLKPEPMLQYSVTKHHVFNHVQTNIQTLEMSTNLKTKKENRRRKEVEVLMEEVKKRKYFLYGKLSEFLTNDKKKAQWRVVSALNAVNKTNKTEAEAR